MPWDNSKNTGKGRDFQAIAAKALAEFFRTEFLTERPFPIGNPPKEHRFDLVSKDRTYVGESKNYSWTEGRNVPSAKMAFLNEAVFYLMHVPDPVRKFIVMRRDVRPSTGETLAEYYHRTYRYLLQDVLILELDSDVGKVREIGV